MAALQVEIGTPAFRLREFCLKWIAHDLKAGAISEDDAQNCKILMAYFCNHQYNSMHDIIGLQIIAQRWSDRPGYDLVWRRVWPCCATCARNIGNTGESAVLPETDEKTLPCAACGQLTDGQFFVLRSPDMARTRPVKTHAQYGRN